MPKSSVSAAPLPRFRIVDVGYMDLPGSSSSSSRSRDVVSDGPRRPIVEMSSPAAGEQPAEDPRDRRLSERAGVPDAWPALLNRKQLTVYVGLSWSSLVGVCPVAPVDLGVSVVRYDRHKIDHWISTLPPRGARTGLEAKAEADHNELSQIRDGRLTALENARVRAAKTG